MSRSARLAMIDRVLREAPAHELAEVAAALLREHFAALRVEFYLADLRFVLLGPVLDPEADPVPVVGTEVGRAFREQRPTGGTSPAEIHRFLPMTVRGEPVGVLEVVLPAESAPHDLADVELVAQSTAHALLLADVATDRYRRVRRPRALTLAAEMQWQLLPVRAVSGAGFSLAGQLEPAYAVRGDNFDWAQDGAQLTIAVTNGMGESVEAATLTTLAITALRNARRGGAGIADQAMLTDQAIWAQHGGTHHVSTLLLELDVGTGRCLAVDAGSPQLWRIRADEVQRVHLDEQLPLGMAEETVYEVQSFWLEPGDRLVVLSDGVYDAVIGGTTYSERSLRRTLLAGRVLPPAQALRVLLSDLRVFLQDHELDDDAVAVFLDWTGNE
ncbi:PP2C family protein-serine/threonine phosphatase [Saccharopolyspora sp. MS10]|uniref:PP2C family protein-serine/threonine phosphatase n=1 Tax=Saccharopolyspora sp. MS10 TaxID=3385973 RepID=UPI0039A04012